MTRLSFASIFEKSRVLKLNLNSISLNLKIGQIQKSGQSVENSFYFTYYLTFIMGQISQFKSE